MTVEEYLDYELANGKMLKDEVKDNNPANKDDNDSDTEDSEAEEEKDDGMIGKMKILKVLVI